MIEYIEITLKHSNLENYCFRYIRLIAQNESFSCDLLNFFNRYGLFLMVPGKSSCPEGSEYVWQRGGRGCLRPSYGRPKLTLVSTFVAS